MPSSSNEYSITRYDSGEFVEKMDHVAAEEPLEIRVEGTSVAIVMRTPGHDEELTAGFLLSEGIITSRADVFEISQCPSQPGQQGNVIDVLLTDSTKLDLEKLSRNVFTSSSCGICGKATIESVFQQFPPVVSEHMVAPVDLLTFPDKIRAAQRTFDKTGGLHASAVFDAQGEIVVLREDVGRHNALDKVIGHALMNDLLPLAKHSLMLSGRISFELMQKALSAGIPIVAGISAPSSLAVEFARESGQALAGFLRGETMNIYAGTHRISAVEKA
jgi:FdhD protein